jgi:hypothetical protein
MLTINTNSNPLELAHSKKYGINQHGEGGVTIGDNDNDAQSVKMSGNAWRAFPFQHQVTRNTVLKFDFELRAKAEGHAICLDEDTNEDVELGGNLRCFVVGGTQTDLWADVYHLQETTQGHKASYVVNIGAANSVGSRAYINPGTQINYLAFIQDNDREPHVGESVFSNIQIYEKTNVSSKHAKSVNCHAMSTTLQF